MDKVVVTKSKLDILAQHINEKAGTTGAKTIAQMQATVDGITVGGGAPSLQSKSVTYTANGTATITPDSGYDGLSSVDVTVDVSGGGSSGGGYLKGVRLKSITLQITLIDVSVVSCAFTSCTCIFNTECSNVTFKDCSFDYCTIMCTQEIRDAIENGEGNSCTDVKWMIF